MTTYNDGSPMPRAVAARADAARFFACGCRTWRPHQRDCQWSDTNERDAGVIAAERDARHARIGLPVIDGSQTVLTGSW